jgi:prolyl oligopeptidase
MNLHYFFRLFFIGIAFSCVALGFTSESIPSPQQIDAPYLWLENSEDPLTITWLENQKLMFSNYVKTLDHRNGIKSRLEEICHYESYAIPMRSGENYFFMHKQGMEEQPSLYIQKGKDGIPQRLINPQDCSLNGLASIQSFNISPDGTILAYGISESGSDWIKWYFYNIPTDNHLSDTIEKTKFSSLVWSQDSQGCYYAGFDEKEVHGLYYHALGNSQSDDKLIYREELNSENYFYTPLMSCDSRYLLLYISQKSQGLTKIIYNELDGGNNQFFELVPYSFSNYEFICNKGDDFYFLTDHEAPFRKLIVLNIKEPALLKELIPEGKVLINQIIPILDNFLVSTIEDVNAQLACYNSQGICIKKLTLPDYGTVQFSWGISEEAEEVCEVLFSFTNFLQPQVIYSYDIKSHALEVFKKSVLNFDTCKYETRQVFYPSKDGALIPMYLIHKKNLKLDKSHNVMLYGYGGFNVGVFPFFSPLHLVWLENNGILAVANIRGGSEYGEEWHAAGMRDKKQNCFNDFISAAEWLISNCYTRPSKLAIRGMSNGGLLIAACLNQQPDLFGAAQVGVGVLDMLRYHLFTVGHFWMREYGNPDDPVDFDILLRYSPVHNVRRGTRYPATIVTTGDHDDRVVPLHSYKYTAVMQDAQSGKKPILLRVDSQAGHGFGKPLSKWIDESTDVLSFFIQELN